MSFKLEMSQETLDFSLLIKESDMVSDKILKKCATVIKGNTEKRLRSIKTKTIKDVHMCDDVVVRTGKDTYGYRFAKVGGGKRTGTKWHLVNDGTYVTDPTHFMDNAIKDSELEIARIIDTELKKVFK